MEDGLSIQSAEFLRQLVDFLLEPYLPAPLVPSGMVLLVRVHDKRMEMDRTSRRIEERIDYPSVSFQLGPRHSSPLQAIGRQIRLPRPADRCTEGVHLVMWYDQAAENQKPVLGLAALVHVDVSNRQVGHRTTGGYGDGETCAEAGPGRTSMTAGKEPKSQSDRFIEKARDLECDEDEERFNKTLKRIVSRDRSKAETGAEEPKDDS